MHCIPRNILKVNTSALNNRKIPYYFETVYLKVKQNKILEFLLSYTIRKQYKILPDNKLSCKRLLWVINKHVKCCR